MLQETLERHGVVRQAPEIGLGQVGLEKGWGLQGMKVCSCGLTRMRIVVMMTVMKVFLVSDVHWTRRRWWES